MVVVALEADEGPPGESLGMAELPGLVTPMSMASTQTSMRVHVQHGHVDSRGGCIRTRLTTSHEQKQMCSQAPTRLADHIIVQFSTSQVNVSCIVSVIRRRQPQALGTCCCACTQTRLWFCLAAMRRGCQNCGGFSGGVSGKVFASVSIAVRASMKTSFGLHHLPSWE